MATEMGAELLTEEEYRALQAKGELDTKTSSWVKTPADVRELTRSLRENHVNVSGGYLMTGLDFTVFQNGPAKGVQAGPGGVTPARRVQKRTAGQLDGVIEGRADVRGLLIDRGAPRGRGHR